MSGFLWCLLQFQHNLKWGSFTYYINTHICLLRYRYHKFKYNLTLSNFQLLNVLFNNFSFCYVINLLSKYLPLSLLFLFTMISTPVIETIICLVIFKNKNYSCLQFIKLQSLRTILYFQIKRKLFPNMFIFC